MSTVRWSLERQPFAAPVGGMAAAGATNAGWLIVRASGGGYGYRVGVSVAQARMARVGRWAAAGESAVTRRLHRAFFATVARLPRPASRWAQARIFNGLFASGTPWPYAESSYESTKRDHLISGVPERARMIVEVGCADGHNLELLAARSTDARVIGVDISSRACSLARGRIRANPEVSSRVDVVHTDTTTFAGRRHDLHGCVDVIVLSEVLYYLGSGRVFADQVKPLGRLLAPDGQVVAVHTCADAPALHTRLANALGLTPTSENEISADGQAFTISVLSR